MLSHDTALDLHDLCDVNPDKIHLTVPAGRYRPRREGGEVYVVHHEELADDDITRHEGIPIAHVGVAIRQGIASGVGGHLLLQALATARGRGSISATEHDELAAALAARR